MRLALVTRVMLDALAFASLITFAFATEPLPGTAPLDWPEEDLSGRMMDGAHRFVEGQIADAIRKRHEVWKQNTPRHIYHNNETNGGLLGLAIGAVNPQLADSRPDLFRK